MRPLIKRIMRYKSTLPHETINTKNNEVVLICNAVDVNHHFYIYDFVLRNTSIAVFMNPYKCRSKQKIPRYFNLRSILVIGFVVDSCIDFY